MKKLFAMAALVLSSVGAFAQYSAGDVTLQPKVGLNIADLTDTEGSKTRAGFVGGVEFEYHISPLVGFSGGLLYSMQGYKENGDLGKISDDLAGATKTTKNDYLNIPILANFYVAQGLAIKAGIQPGFKINSKETLDTDDLSVSGDLKNTFNSFDLSIPVGISYEYQGIVLDARYNIGATKVMDYSNCRNSVFQLTLGYKFKL